MKLSFVSMELHNFKGVAGKLVWKFHEQPGFYFVRGENKKEPRLGGNGVGKTTLFVDAPYWILTGKTILSQRPGALVENWDQGNLVYGKMHLILNEVDYLIERGRNPSILTLNEITVQQIEIDKLLPLSDAALRRTLLLGQRSPLFLDLRPEDKARLFSETLDLARWLNASDRAGERVKTLDSALIFTRGDIAGAKSRSDLLRDQHDAAIEKEAAFNTNHVSRLATIDRELATRKEEATGVRDTLREARNALSTLMVPGAADQESPLQRLAQARQDERTKRQRLGAIEGNLRNVRMKEQETRAQLHAYEDDSYCPECGQPVTQQHMEEKRTHLSERIAATAELGDEFAGEANALDMELLGIADTIRELEKEAKQGEEIRHEIEILEVKEINITRSLEIMSKERDRTTKENNPFTAICDDLETRYGEEKKQITALEEKYKSIESELEIYKFWQKGFRDIRLELIDATLLELELTTNRNAQALGLEGWKIEFSTERETKSGAVSQVFTVLLYPPGQTEPIDWNAFSGGESQRWHIAVTCGLSEVLLSRAGIDPDIEVYDEVTNYISSEGIEDVLEFLKERSIELGRKIYLIDHHVGVGDFTDVVNLVKDEAGIRIEKTA
jgi:hypothetical protein